MVRRKGLPQVGELIVCTVNKLTENAAWCKLDEYPELEGMVHVSESAGRWVYNIKDVVKTGKQYVAKVVNVEPRSGQISLSLKRVSRYDEKKKVNQFRKEQRAENILNQIAKSMNKKLDDAYEEVGFLLQENFGELSDAFEEVTNDNTVLDKIEIRKEWKDAIVSTVNKIFAGKKIVLKAELDVKCYSEDGVDVIKRALSDLESKGFMVKYISAPKYTIEVMTNDPKKKEKEIVSDLENLARVMKANNGESSYKMIK